MLANFHTHTSFCDGKNTPEEIVVSAIEKGFDSIGFSGHGYTPFDERYCMKDMVGYINDITNLKKKYKGKIQIYLGCEEDAFAPVERKNFDYIIGSSHYFCLEGRFYPIDSSYDYFKKCLKLFNGDALKLAEAYYESFCNYIISRTPDIVGHFDLITKFDEIDTPLFLSDSGYLKLADQYMEKIACCDVLFEVNTGAISRGVRKTPYPHENLLHILKKHDGRIIISSDSHSADTLDFGFKETRKFLCDIGFQYVYLLYNNSFIKDFLR